MANYTQIRGFYVALGSKDYPSLWSPTSKFGFQSIEDRSTAVFNSSMYDVMNVFKEPITFMRAFSIVSVPTANFISQLIFEKPVADFNTNAVYADSNDNRWITVAMILDYLFLHQDTRNTLVSNFESNLSQILPPARLSHYVADSLSIGIQDSVDVSRINFVKFTINHGPNDNVEYMVYFNPDKLLANETANRSSVFVYEDLNSDEYISKEEWEKQIVEKHIEIFGGARYSQYKTFPTTYRAQDGSTIQHYFFVYSITILQIENVKNTIREFLLTSRRGVNGVYPPYTHAECVFHYPNLFSESSTTIIPIDNYMDDNTSHSSPVSFDKISYILSSNDYESGNLNYKNCELFFIGSEEDGITYDLPFAAIAISDDENDSLKPISTKYPNYVPVYSTINVATEEVQYKIFHKLVRLAFSILYDIITINSTIVTDIITSNPDFNLSETVINNKKHISFMLSGVTYIVKKS